MPNSTISIRANDNLVYERDPGKQADRGYENMGAVREIGTSRGGKALKERAKSSVITAESCEEITGEEVKT